MVKFEKFRSLEHSILSVFNPNVKALKDSITYQFIFKDKPKLFFEFAVDHWWKEGFFTFVNCYLNNDKDEFGVNLYVLFFGVSVGIYK